MSEPVACRFMGSSVFILRQHNVQENGQQSGGDDAGAAEEADAHRDQAQADSRHHYAGDHRWEEPAQGLDEEAQHHFSHAADEGRAHHRAVGVNTGLQIGGDGPGADARHHADGDGLVDADEAEGGAMTMGSRPPMGPMG